ADAVYRLFINGHWVEDGPCRSWPGHFQYDVLDVTALLHPGENEIVVVARHFGMSTFHRVPREAGLLAQLDVVAADGTPLCIATDARWQAARGAAHVADTARISIQMDQAEWYDARLAAAMDWAPAKAYYPATGGPWQDLHPRDVRFLTREPIFPVRVYETAVVTAPARHFTFDLKRICFPEDRTANGCAFAVVLATVLESETAREIPVHGGTALYCNGARVDDGALRLRAGENLLAMVVNSVGHLYDTTLIFPQWDGLTARNPLRPDDENPWLVIDPPGERDAVSAIAGYPGRPAVSDAIAATMTALAQQPDAAALCAAAGPLCRVIPRAVMLPKDAYPDFRHRRVVRPADDLLTDPAALLADNREWTTISPAPEGDVELCLDLGKEVVGYLTFELTAPAGTVVDAHLIEYREGARLQHTGHRNGFRYICRAGVNRFVSMRRRAGRYLFLTLRGMTGPVRIRTVSLLQATYPVEHRGAFRCADSAFTRIWEISAYTLRLCMEDTFTDCPLYEQTLWVGDARNEALYNAICYGADDLTLRCLRLTAQSLDHLPITGCQVPSGWDILLPAWSFLWGIGVWEHYFAGGDRAALEELYPAVLRNLRGAESFCTDRGLFSLPAWNLFDWAPIDQDHCTVLHNSLFLLGALQAAQQCCDALGAADGPWLTAFHERLRAAVLARWDAERGSYPDAIHEDGTVSARTSQHTSALALLYDALPAGAEAAALRNLLDPPAEMTRIGSPFALQYVLEALEKAGRDADAVRFVRELWQGMLDADATTCWEGFPQPDSSFPTRSHCHAWSSAPVYVFTRTILGMRPAAPGAAEVVVSPRPCGLAHAEGASASPLGDLRVAWRVEGETLAITVEMPAGVNWRVEPNADWAAFSAVTVNGAAVARAIAGATDR
ncbi:MAG TPA: alpha-L-rhamnosidase N-terminal domain-containing protein, partial [Armatimonadota bacterium]|nr:alpha-L-rhamnosidase N-terminal domain-containing protein [Armatimonadota bacterium]